MTHEVIIRHAIIPDDDPFTGRPDPRGGSDVYVGVCLECGWIGDEFTYRFDAEGDADEHLSHAGRFNTGDD